ncbi:MAG: hypothetical protein HYX59_15270 [Elusimicrobia bacterium]|nr:hypothetical protein [Elusimicrobiota bacterium]
MLALALWLMVAAPVAAAPDEGAAQCVEDPGCPYSCCRKRTPNSPCYCSACCTAAAAGESGEVYWGGGRVALLKRSSVEFYRLPKGVLAFVGVSSGTAKPLEQAVLPRGRLYFRRAATRVSVAPAVVRRFAGDLLSPGHASGSRSAFLVCSTVATEFCGGVDLAGKVIFQLPVRSGSPVEPRGITEDGSEALFALIGAAPRRETIGYVLREKDGTMREAAVDDPHARRLLKAFEGSAVLPEP